MDSRAHRKRSSAGRKIPAIAYEDSEESKGVTPQHFEVVQNVEILYGRLGSPFHPELLGGD
jgi:hypothetical protein